MNKSLKPLILLGLILIIGVLFLTGSSLLIYDFFGIPLGNLLVWIGLVILQFFVFIINKRFLHPDTIFVKLLRMAAIVLLVFSFLWFAIAYVLSGNVNFNFSSQSRNFVGSIEASIWYWNLIYVLTIAPLVLTVIYQLIRWLKKVNNRAKG